MAKNGFNLITIDELFLLLVIYAIVQLALTRNNKLYLIDIKNQMNDAIRELQVRLESQALQIGELKALTTGLQAQRRSARLSDYEHVKQVESYGTVSK